MSRNIISQIEPLQPEYVPSKFIERNKIQETLSNLLGKNSSRNVHLEGPPGTGKTHLTHSQVNQLSGDVQTCYINCITADTQYKALKQILQTLTQEKIRSGYHTSTLQRKVEQQTGALHTVIVLDEIDFLLHNDGDDLLYYLSRIKNSTSVNTVTISSTSTNLKQQIEERTHSSLQPYPVQLEPYTGEQHYNILHTRAQHALKPQTLQQNALTYIASTTSNPALSLQWLKTAATETDTVITETTVKNTETQARQKYVEHLLQPFTQHHSLLYTSIQQLSEKQDTIHTGTVYKQYGELCETKDIEPLSNRRISDHLKQLELLQLITAQYHYGGNTGKTRKIQLKQ